MNWTLRLLAILVLLAVPFTMGAQVANENLSNAVIAARKKNTALLQTYTWNCRTELMKNSTVQDIRIDLVSYGPGGNIQRSLVNDQPGQLPRGFLRRAIAEDQRKQLESQVQALSGIVDQYTLPSAGKIVDFLASATLQPGTNAAGKTVLQANGTNVVVPGDSFNLTLDGTSLLPISAQINTTWNNQAVVVTVSFQTMRSGLNYPQYVTAEVTGAGITAMIHNYDYTSNN